MSNGDSKPLKSTLRGSIPIGGIEGMTVSSALISRFHQTPVSAAIRNTPGISALARRWWLSQQSQRFCAALSNVSDPQVDGPTGTVEVPSLEDIQRGYRSTAGSAFVKEMSSYCTTTKFMYLGYEDVYSQICRHLRDSNARVLEVGIGVNDPNAPSGMSASHTPGSSLVGWSHYLRGSEVHGADIDRRVLIDTPDYRTHYVDQRDPHTLEELANAVGGALDLIVDDGLHTAEANALTVQTLLPRMSRRGVMVVEDVLPEFNELWENAERLLNQHYRMRFYSGSVLQGRNKRDGLAIFWRIA